MMSHYNAGISATINVVFLLEHTLWGIAPGGRGGFPGDALSRLCPCEAAAGTEGA